MDSKTKRNRLAADALLMMLANYLTYFSPQFDLLLTPFALSFLRGSAPAGIPVTSTCTYFPAELDLQRMQKLFLLFMGNFGNRICFGWNNHNRLQKETVKCDQGGIEDGSRFATTGR